VAVDVELSRAVTVSVTAPGYPRSAELVAAFGAAAAAELTVRVERLVGEMFGLPQPWLEQAEPMELSEVGSVIGAAMSARHPELSREAVSSLANYYSYCWK
jgi:hypothetical protein